MTSVTFWSVILLSGLGTLAMRAVPMLAHGRLRASPFVEHMLRYVPAASLAALVVPGSILIARNGGYGVEPQRIVALAVAIVVALKWRNVALTLLVGMATLWALQAIA